MSSSEKTYKVGRGRPPVETQFKPGQSGNPSGRPKRRRSFKTDMLAALDTLTTGANGDTTKQQKFANDLMNDALARDPLARKMVAQLALSLDEDENNNEDHASAQEQKLIDEYNRREQPTESTGTSEDENHE